MRLLLLMLAVLMVPAGAVSREIPWSPERPLTWSDFEGTVPGQADPDNVAVTAASLGWAYEYDVSYSTSSCTYRITAIRSTVVFDTEQSWVRPGHRTPAVLEHEQGHFDIAQIHKLMFDEAVADLIGTQGMCEGGNARTASADAEDRIARVVKPVHERVWRDLMSVQDSYDAQTRHGMDAAAQQRWLERIAAGLRGQQWE